MVLRLVFLEVRIPGYHFRGQELMLIHLVSRGLFEIGLFSGAVAVISGVFPVWNV